jgi:dolichyl-phosphate-mannose-protein mannosyltransferase
MSWYKKYYYHKPGVLNLVILFSLLQVLVAFLTYEHTLTFDEAMWQYIGRNWFRNGLVPYSGGVDNKSPLIFVVFGLSDKLFGVNFIFPRLLGVCAQSSGLYFIYKIAKQFSGERAGMLAIVIYGLSLLWPSTGSKYVSYTETYAVAFIIAALYYAVSAKQNSVFFISGVLAAIAFMFRISAFFGILAILITLLRGKKKIVIIFLAGTFSGAAAICMLMYFSGIHVHDIFIYAFTDNFGTGSVTDHPLSWKLGNLLNHFFYSKIILFFPGLIMYFFTKVKSNIFIIWFIVEFTGISIIGLYSVQHFKSILPSLSLINAFAIIHLVENYKLSLKQITIVTWICFFPKILEPFRSLTAILKNTNKNSTDDSNMNNPDDDYTKRKLGLWIKSHTTVQTKVLIAGYGAIAQAYSERISPSIYFNVTQTRTAKEKFFTETYLNKPEMIAVPIASRYDTIISADIRNYISQMVAHNYSFERNIYGYSVYNIKMNSNK